MKIPSVATAVGGIAEGAVQALRAGVQSAAGAAGAMQMLASPVVRSVGQSTGRVLGTTHNSSAGHAAPASAPRAGGL